MDFANSADHRVKLKEREKKDKYLDLARDLKNVWKVPLKPILIGAIRMVPNILVYRVDDLKWENKLRRSRL